MTSLKVFKLIFRWVVFSFGQSSSIAKFPASFNKSYHAEKVNKFEKSISSKNCKFVKYLRNVLVAYHCKNMVKVTFKIVVRISNFILIKFDDDLRSVHLRKLDIFYFSPIQGACSGLN